LLAVFDGASPCSEAPRHLDRLRRIRELLRKRSGPDASGTHLLCLSGAGFTHDLRAVAAADPAVQLIDLDRLYRGE
jgi:hypothetical protein